MFLVILGWNNEKIEGKDDGEVTRLIPVKSEWKLGTLCVKVESFLR